MSHKILGVDLFRVSTTQKNELGIVVQDVRGGQGILTFTELLPATGASGGLTQVTTTRRYDPEGLYKYIFASAGITEGNAVQLNIAATPITRHADVIHTTAVDQIIEGVAIVTIPIGQFGWVQVGGLHYQVNALDTVANGASLTTSAVAGQLIDAGAVPTALNVLQIAMGRRIRKTAAASSIGGLVNRALCLIKG